MNLTNNFTLEELIHTNYNIENKPNDEEIQNLTKLAATLQAIRDVYQKPIIISSGFRCKKLNKMVGGASNSDHVFGCAADIHAVKNEPYQNKLLFDLICSMIKNEKIECRQLIDEKNYKWIHISINNMHNKYRKNQILHL